MATRGGSELMAAWNSVQEIAKTVTADSLGYLSREGLHEAAKAEPRSFCDACFTGEYLVQLTPPEMGASGEHRPQEGKPTGAAENLTVLRAGGQASGPRPQENQNPRY